MAVFPPTAALPPLRASETETLEAPRPRGLLVARPGGLGPGGGLVEGALDLRALSLHRPLGGVVDDDLAPLASEAFDIILLDGGLPASRIEAVLRRLSPPGAPDRPAILVVNPDEGRPAIDRALLGDAGDFVDGSRGEGELLGRIQALLRFRCCLADLSRKNGELEALYGRLEAMAGRMAEELRLASNVQRSLLPPPLQHPRLDVAREFMPFREIGGDYYDLVPLGPHRVAFAIGDVMGKGVPAALLASTLKASLRAQLQSGDRAPEAVVARVNRLFWEVTPKGLFASLFFAVLDLEAGQVEYVNAGHDYPFRVRPNSALQDLSEGGTLLGLVEDSRYERGRIAVQPGDLLVFYSDGVTDRANVEGEMYGVDRLKEATVRSRRDSARIALYTLLGEIQGWSAGRSAEDDMTLVVMKVA